MKEFKNDLIAFAILAILWSAVFTTLGYYIGDTGSPRFFDGDGNQIPPRVVTTLVRSQYVYVTYKEDSTLRQWFPAYSAQPGKIFNPSK